MISAAEHAAATGESTFSPTSGFHHAGWDSGHAFCTFNGLLVAALKLRLQRRVQRVAILDLDAHFGDGTRDIIRRLGLGWVRHYTFGEDPPTRRRAGHGSMTAGPGAPHRGACRRSVLPGRSRSPRR
jgi:acetoin utilization deacetylase AcuC-like enzyme